MSRGGRRLTDEEKVIWSKVAATVTPLEPKRPAVKELAAIDKKAAPLAPPLPLKKTRTKMAFISAPVPVPPAPNKRPLDQHGLDANWDRKLGRGMVHPDFTLDLHGCTLDQAYVRLDIGIAQALAQGARVLLLITGRPRSADERMRGDGRGAIRAKFMDWITHGSHASRISAVRGAHPRHGGAGAVYIILKRPR